MPDTAGNLGLRKHDDTLVTHACTLTRCRAPGTGGQIHAAAPQPQRLSRGLVFLIRARVRRNTEGGRYPWNLQAGRGDRSSIPTRAPSQNGGDGERGFYAETESAGYTESKTETDRKGNGRERKQHIISVKSPGRNSLFVE